MATVNLWKNVSVTMQSVLAGSKTVSAISKASEGVVSCTGNGYTNGDYVLITAVGMTQINNRIVRVKSVATDSFTAEGIDTTLYDTYVSGGAQKITFGNTITTATTMNGSGGNFDFIDTTTIHSNQKTNVPGLANPITYTFDNLWDPSDAGQIAMKTASDSSAQRAFKITFSTGAIVLFSGYVGFAGAPGGSAQDKVTSQAAITVYGNITNYAS